MSDQHTVVKRIEEICTEFDARESIVGKTFARAELAHAMAETEDQLAALRAERDALRELVNDLVEHGAFYPSAWVERASAALAAAPEEQKP